MSFVFDSESFAKAIRTKRLIEMDVDIRRAAKKIGVSAATLSRCENRSMPELITFFKLCYWLNRPANDFVLQYKKEINKPKSKKK